MNIFEEAAKRKLRYETTRGMISTEDLYDLPLSSSTGKPNLDAIAKALHREIRNNDETLSFVTPSSNSGAEEILNLKFEIVKHVIEVRVAENKLIAEATKKREEKQKIMGIISRKQDEALEGKSLEELTSLVENM